MSIKKGTYKDIFFLVALYSNLFFGYQYVQTFKELNSKNEILINELEKKLNLYKVSLAKSD